MFTPEETRRRTAARLMEATMSIASHLQNYLDEGADENDRAFSLGEAMSELSESLPNCQTEFDSAAKVACAAGKHVYVVDADVENGSEDICCVICGDGHHAQF